MTDHCANCGEPLRGPFCSACGQENRNLARLSLGQILGEWLGEAFTFDSRLFRTLVPLVRRPGFLTGEYLAGRRARYVPPLRLFVFMSLVTFLALALTGAKFAWSVEQDGQEVVAFDPREGATVTPRQQPPRAAEPPPADPEAVPVGSQPGYSTSPSPQGEAARFRVLDDPEEMSRRILDRAPQAMLVLVPVFAFFLWLAHRQRVPLYMPHLIFSLHLHSFAFLVMLIVCLVDAPFPFEYRFGNLLLVLSMPPYLYLAQRRVYGGGRLATLVRTAGLVLAHTTAWVMLMLVVLMVVILFA